MLAAMVLLVLISSALFAYSVMLRTPWFGTSPVCPDTWLQAASVLWSRTWHREGAILLRFGLFWEPASIEKPTLESRAIYSSYPPGVVLPIHALGTLLHRDPSLKMVMAYGLFCQWATAMAASLTVFLAVRRMRGGLFETTVLGIIPAIGILFLPSPFFEFQMGYLHDVAVIPLFALYILLETVRDASDRKGIRRLCSATQGVLAFFGLLTDWLFAFAVFGLYLKRVAGGEMTRCDNACAMGARAKRFLWGSLVFGWPAVLALGLFAAQLHTFRQFTVIAGRFQERVGMQHGHFSHFSFDNHFWNAHLVRGFGPAGRYAAIACLAAVVLLLLYAAIRGAMHKPPNTPARGGIAAMFLAIVPCVMHVCVFPQHSSHVFHFFAAARFAIPLSTIPLALFPATVLAWNASPWRVWMLRTLAPVLLIAAAAYTWTLWPQARGQFLPPPKEDPVVYGRFIHGHTGFADICFTPHPSREILAMPSQPPLPLAYSLKQVYPAHTLKDIRGVLDHVDGEYTVNIVLSKSGPPTPGDLQDLTDRAYRRDENRETAIYKIRKKDFLQAAGER